MKKLARKTGHFLEYHSALSSLAIGKKCIVCAVILNAGLHQIIDPRKVTYGVSICVMTRNFLGNIPIYPNFPGISLPGAGGEAVAVAVAAVLAAGADKFVMLPPKEPDLL